jgi:CRP-like cAMP-binding protein
MEETILKKIPCSQFLARLGRDALLEGFVRYLAMRIADQQQVIAHLVTVDSEQRLGKTLLQLARTLGKKGQQSTRIELKISHDELSEMVGTTRPRISMFMQRFHNLGLLETNLDRFLGINEKKLTDYLARRAAGHVCARRYDSRQNRPVLDSNLFRVSVRLNSIRR